MDDWQWGVPCRYIRWISCPSQGPSAALRLFRTWCQCTSLDNREFALKPLIRGVNRGHVLQRLLRVSFSLPLYCFSLLVSWNVKFDGFCFIDSFSCGYSEKWVKEALFLPVCTVAYRLNSFTEENSGGLPGLFEMVSSQPEMSLHLPSCRPLLSTYCWPVLMRLHWKGLVSSLRSFLLQGFCLYSFLVGVFWVGFPWPPRSLEFKAI